MNIGSMFRIEYGKYYSYDVTAHVTNWRRRALVRQVDAAYDFSLCVCVCVCVCLGGEIVRFSSYVASNGMMTDN
jgi:hypothetical protein